MPEDDLIALQKKLEAIVSKASLAQLGEALRETYVQNMLSRSQESENFQKNEVELNPVFTQIEDDLAKGKSTVSEEDLKKTTEFSLSSMKLALASKHAAQAFVGYIDATEAALNDHKLSFHAFVAAKTENPGDDNVVTGIKELIHKIEDVTHKPFDPSEAVRLLRSLDRKSVEKAR